MNRVLAILTAGTMVLGTSVFAQDAKVGGKVSLDFSENTAGDWGGKMGVDVDVDSSAGGVALDFIATDSGNLKLDNWTVGTSVGGVALAFGDDNGLMPTTTADAAADGTLTVPAMTESLQASMGAASVAIGFTDWNSDITDISNLQGAYTVGALVTASIDYNLDSNNTILGAEIADRDLGIASLGGAVTYDMDAEIFGFETIAKTGSLTSYLNGDQDDPLQNIGTEYTHAMSQGVDFTAGANYNIDDEKLAPTVGLSFSF